ncbi:MAG: response regulator [Ignavibacteria bacterium]|nr:response regulator [Ignavibacteria bacterium]
MSKADILIVEDDILTASVIRKYLEKNNYNVTYIIEDGETAVEKALSTKPDLILMDIFLKDSIDGIEVAQRIKRKVDIPVIFLTADSSKDTIQRAKITEPFGYLVKPVDSSVLITNIDLTLQKQISYNKKILDTLQKANDELERRVKIRTEELFKANEVLKSEMEQRKQAEEELRKADRLATIGKMSAVLAHEIRNPLNSIRINADILNETVVFTENQKRRIRIIQKEVDRLNNLVKDVLMFSRQSGLIAIEFNLKNLIDGIHQQIVNVIEEKKIVFDNRIPDIKIKGDLEKLKQVFLNLILNSVDAIFEDGTITITANVDNETNNLCISVIDNGCGVANSEKMFEPFYTSKNLGTGLGLSISQNIIKQHNGELKLFSSKPGETIFHILLPYNN